MSDVKWIKITTDMFDNRKIKHLRRLPEGNNIVLIWVMLLTMAGRCNASGMIFLTENIPYTPKMLADELDFEESTVQLALTTLEQLGMISTDGFLSITSWEEYQNTDKLSEIREQNRIRKQNQRARERLELPMSRDGHVTVSECHATDIDKEIEIEKDKSKKSKRKTDDPFSPYKDSNPALYEALKAYEEMRKQMKKPLTNVSKGMLLSKLGGFADEEWIPMLHEAINHNWLSVYPLKAKAIKKAATAVVDNNDSIDLDRLKSAFDRI